MKVNFNIGEDVEIYEKTVSTDNEGNPFYVWILKSTEKAFFIRRTIKTYKIKEGIPDVGMNGKFILSPDSVVEAGNRIKYQNQTFRVISVISLSYRDKVLYKEAEVALIED